MQGLAADSPIMATDAGVKNLFKSKPYSFLIYLLSPPVSVIPEFLLTPGNQPYSTPAAGSYHVEGCLSIKCILKTDHRRPGFGITDDLDRIFYSFGAGVGKYAHFGKIIGRQSVQAGARSTYDAYMPT